MGLTLTKKQRKAWKLLTSKAYTKYFLGGGKRAGKTDVVIEYMVMRALTFTESAQLIARKALSHARDSIWSSPSGSLHKYLRNFIPHEWYRLNDTKLRATFANGSAIQIAGLDDKDRTEKAFGTDYITVYLNECTQMTWPTCQTALTLTSQVAYDGKGRRAVPKFIMDCNPRGPRHWSRKVGMLQVDPETDKPMADRKTWASMGDWTPYDNIENLAPEYVKILENLTGTMRLRMLDGIWVADEGLVYGEFSHEQHVCKQCDDKPSRCPRHEKSRKTVSGCDFGFTNPFCWLWVCLDEDGRALVFDEHYEAETIVEDHAKKILARELPWSWSVADHDAEDAATLKRHGVKTRNARKIRVNSGIDLVKARLKVQKDGRPRLEVCQFCENTLTEIDNHFWHDKKEDTPVDDFNHALDPLRYIIVELDSKSSVLVIPIA